MTRFASMRFGKPGTPTQFAASIGAAKLGSLYLDTANGKLYVKESGGWVQK